MRQNKEKYLHKVVLIEQKPKTSTQRLEIGTKHHEAKVKRRKRLNRRYKGLGAYSAIRQRSFLIFRCSTLLRPNNDLEVHLGDDQGDWMTENYNTRGK